MKWPWLSVKPGVIVVPSRSWITVSGVGSALAEFGERGWIEVSFRRLRILNSAELDAFVFTSAPTGGSLQRDSASRARHDGESRRLRTALQSRGDADHQRLRQAHGRCEGAGEGIVVFP
jgi:hypothetical protein